MYFYFDLLKETLYFSENLDFPSHSKYHNTLMSFREFTQSFCQIAWNVVHLTILKFHFMLKRVAFAAISNMMF